MCNKSEIVNKVVAHLKDGNVTEAVDTLLKGRKKYSCMVAILTIMVTESLIRSNDLQALKFFMNKLEYYHTTNMNW